MNKQVRLVVSLAFAVVLMSGAASVGGKPVFAQGSQPTIANEEDGTGQTANTTMSATATNSTGQENGGSNSNNNATATTTATTATATITNETAMTTTPVQYIANIKQLLTQLEGEYKNGNYTQAEKIAEDAYLNNFEHVEGPLDEAGQHELNEQAEHMLKDELRQKINDKVPAGQLSGFIATINEKLDEVEKALG